MSAADTESFSEAVAELCQNQVGDAGLFMPWQLDVIGNNIQVGRLRTHATYSASAGVRALAQPLVQVLAPSWGPFHVPAPCQA
jgi:hypothetical protein